MAMDQIANSNRLGREPIPAKSVDAQDYGRIELDDNQVPG